MAAPRFRAATDKTLKLWDMASGNELRSFTGHTCAVASVAFSPDGRVAAFRQPDNTLKLWEVATGRSCAASAGIRGCHRWRFRPMAARPLRQHDKTLRLWDVCQAASGAASAGIRRVTSVAFSPDGRFALSGSGDKTLKLWEVATGNELRSFNGHTHHVNSVAFSPDGRFALSGSETRR